MDNHNQKTIVGVLRAVVLRLRRHPETWGQFSLHPSDTKSCLIGMIMDEAYEGPGATNKARFGASVEVQKAARSLFKLSAAQVNDNLGIKDALKVARKALKRAER